MNKQVFLVMITSSLILGGAAFADDVNCAAGEFSAAERIEAVKAHYAEQGWQIRKAKVDHGCVELYAKDAKGKRLEAYIDPNTFKVVGYDD
jgi:hypothetical protein